MLLYRAVLVNMNQRMPWHQYAYAGFPWRPLAPAGPRRHEPHAAGRGVCRTGRAHHVVRTARHGLHDQPPGAAVGGRAGPWAVGGCCWRRNGGRPRSRARPSAGGGCTWCIGVRCGGAGWWGGSWGWFRAGRRAGWRGGGAEVRVRDCADAVQEEDREGLPPTAAAAAGRWRWWGTAATCAGRSAAAGSRGEWQAR